MVEDKQYTRDYKDSVDAHNDVINTVPYDALESMESAKVFDLQSKQTKNRLTDSMTDTIYRERAARVVGQLPEGVVNAIGKRDKGKGLFMDLIRTKWIYPNANSQHSLKTKLYMWRKKAYVYNTVCMYVDKTVSPSGYEGPDCWLISPRKAIPQKGKASITDMDYFHIMVDWSPAQFKNDMDDPNSLYDKEAMRELWSSVKEKSSNKDPERDTVQKPVADVKQVQVVTRYEPGKEGRWVTFLPEYSCQIIRNIPNPLENGKIPVVALTSEPEFDSWYGTSDYQRSMPMQAAGDGVLNGYFQGMNKSLNPRTFVDTTTMVDHTWSDKPGSLIEFAGPFTVQPEEVSTAALSNFQAVQGVIKGSLQSMAGTTDTRSNSESASDPAFGKTPEAINKINEREATRDKQDRDTFEEAVKELFDMMLSIIPTLKNKIPLDLLEEEIEEILRDNPDLGQVLTDQDGNELVDEEGEPMRAFHQLLQETNQQGVISMRPSESRQQIRLRVDPAKLKGMEYRFELDPNSTMAQSKEAQLNSFKDLFQFMGTIQNVVQEHPEIVSTIIKTYGKVSDIPHLEEIAQAFEQAHQQEPPNQEPKQLINYRDAPWTVQSQMEADAGYQPATDQDRVEWLRIQMASKNGGNIGQRYTKTNPEPGVEKDPVIEDARARFEKLNQGVPDAPTSPVAGS